MRRTVLTRTSPSELPSSLRTELGVEGFEVIEGTLEAPALQQILQHSPDIALLELSPSEQPADLGIERAREVLPHLKIIFVSRRSAPTDAEIVEQGVFYYTAKPELVELIEVVTAAATAIRQERRETLPWRSTENPTERKGR